MKVLGLESDQPTTAPTAPSILGFRFVVGAGDKRTLIVRNAQHEYVFTKH